VRKKGRKCDTCKASAKQTLRITSPHQHREDLSQTTPRKNKQQTCFRVFNMASKRKTGTKRKQDRLELEDVFEVTEAEGYHQGQGGES